MTYEEFKKSFNRSAPAPLYLVAAEEEFLADEVIDIIADAAIPAAQRSFDYDIVYGGKTSPAAIVAMATAFPMMGDKRVIIVRNSEKLAGAAQEPDEDVEEAEESANEKSREPLIAYVNNPLKSTILILTAEKPDFRRKLFKTFKSKGEIIECKKMKEYQIGSWIEDRVRRDKKKITPEASRMLQEYTGESLRSLTNELEKIYIFIGNRSEITLDDVQAVVGLSKRHSVFELTDAIGRRDAASAIKIVERMMNVGESPQYIITMLMKLFERLWKVVELKDQRLSEEQLMRQLNLSHKFFIKQTMEYFEKYSIRQIESCFRALLAADLELKTRSTDPRVVMDLLIHSLVTDGNNVEKVLGSPFRR